jgi:hypothetical protein
MLLFEPYFFDSQLVSEWNCCHLECRYVLMTEWERNVCSFGGRRD